MNQILSTSDLVGKRIERAVLYEQYATLFFDDGTFVLFSMELYEHGDAEMILSDVAEDTLDLEDMRGLQIISQEEYKVLNDKRREESAAIQEKRDRKLYEQLKKKFG